jgi:PAS domain S-box-containing protein
MDHPICVHGQRFALRKKAWRGCARPIWKGSSTSCRFTRSSSKCKNEELQSAQRLIAESREKYIDLYDFAPVGYFTFDGNGVIMEVNLTGASLVGIERTQLSGRPFSLLVSPQHRDIFFLHCRKTRQTAQAERCELLIQRKDGSLVPVLMESIAVADTAGNVTIRSAVTDITERKRAEEAAARLAAIVESSDDAIIGKSLDGTIVTWNEGAERLYAYSAAEAVGRSISFLVPPQMHEDLFLILTRIERGEHIRHFETTRQKKDGTMVNVSLTISPIFNSSREIIGASTIARDVTERKQAEDAVHKNRDQLELMVRERTVPREGEVTSDPIWLYGWEAIAAHLHCCARTARRYYDEREMPVKRPQGMSVRALKLEIDAWMRKCMELAGKRKRHSP